MPVCRQCKSPTTIKAHIIPAAFTHLAREGEKNLAQLSVHGGRPTQTGTWDPDILCQTCDNKLGVYDAYAIDLLRRLQNIAPQEYAPFEVNEVDVAKLIRFAMAVIWRASLSDRYEFKHVSLGVYEDRFGQTLFENMPVPTAIEVLLFRYRSPTLPMHQIIRHPILRKHNGAYYHDFIAAGWNFIIKAGQVKLSAEMQCFALRENSATIVSANMPFKKTRDESALKYLVNLKRQQKTTYKPSPTS